MSDDPFEAIKATFFQECEELLADLEGNLLTLESGSTDIEVINAVFRAVHSVKGGAGWGRWWRGPGGRAEGRAGHGCGPRRGRAGGRRGSAPG